MAKSPGKQNATTTKKVTNQGNSVYSRYNKKRQTKKRYRGQGKQINTCMRLSEVLNETTSHWIAALEYMEETGDVVMRTKDGHSYEVNDVPREVYEAWLKAPSAGTFFHQNIKDQYNII